MPSYLITGVSRGLGYTWLKHLSSRSTHTVIGLVRNKDATEKRLAADDITNVHLVSADITDVEALRLAADEISKITGGSLDVLVNNAAVSSERTRFKTIVDVPPEALEQELMDSFKSNVVGVAHTINAFLPLIRKGELKKVVTISTMLADTGVVNRFAIDIAAPYAVSKAAVNFLMAKYHAALGGTEGILFMSLSPGAVAKSEAQAAQTTEEEINGRRAMGAKFKEYAPHFKGPITLEDSVRMQLEVIDKATVQTYGGEFVSHFGNKQWL
jgi:NAD(P)-dependent dehydrogenase (short-subunit alcohol dehydrogenase family)